MSLKDMLAESKNKELAHSRNKNDEDITKERLLEILDPMRRLIAYWRVYPDKFVDFMCSLNPDNHFQLRLSQRIYLRSFMRHRRRYYTFVRGYSKSFLADLGMVIQSILYPGAELFTVADNKQQSADVLQAKINDIIKFIPAIGKEIIWDTRGTNATTRQTKDSVMYTFHNGSFMRNITASENSRGLRFHAGVVEECAKFNDQKILQEVIIPMMAVKRPIKGVPDPKEIFNQGECYITSAGYKNTYSYEKLIQVLCQMIVRPKEAIVMGADWKLSVREGGLDPDFLQQQQMSGEFNADGFEREFGSIWTGSVEGAFFIAEQFNMCRDIVNAEKHRDERIGKDSFYVMGVDVGRIGCTTEVMILKCTKRADTKSYVLDKKVVAMYTYEEEHFGLQSINIKRLFNAYKCAAAVVDGNGIGIGLVDFLITDQIDPDTGEMLYNMGVINDEDGKYRKFRDANTIVNAIYIMKATQQINSDLYSYLYANISTKRIHFLVDENAAKERAAKLNMRPDNRAEFLIPYSQTSILREQLMNLVRPKEKNLQSGLVILEQSNKRIPKDKVSALIYAMFYCKDLEDRFSRRRGHDIGQMMYYTGK